MNCKNQKSVYDWFASIEKRTSQKHEKFSRTKIDFIMFFFLVFDFDISQPTIKIFFSVWFFSLSVLQAQMHTQLNELRIKEWKRKQISRTIFHEPSVYRNSFNKTNNFSVEYIDQNSILFSLNFLYVSANYMNGSHLNHTWKRTLVSIQPVW